MSNDECRTPNRHQAHSLASSFVIRHSSLVIRYCVVNMRARRAQVMTEGSNVQPLAASIDPQSCRFRGRRAWVQLSCTACIVSVAERGQRTACPSSPPLRGGFCPPRRGGLLQTPPRAAFRNRNHIARHDSESVWAGPLRPARPCTGQRCPAHRPAQLCRLSHSWPLIQNRGERAYPPEGIGAFGRKPLPPM